MTATTSACWHHPRTPAQSGAATPRFARAATQPWAISPAEKKGPMGGLSPSSVKSTRTSRTKSLKIQRVSATSDRLSQRVQQSGFTSYKLDGETGLYAARARMYSGRLGRFISRDPMRFIDGMNLYSGYFVPNKSDPDGTYSITKEGCKITVKEVWKVIYVEVPGGIGWTMWRRYLWKNRMIDGVNDTWDKTLKPTDKTSKDCCKCPEGIEVDFELIIQHNPSNPDKTITVSDDPNARSSMSVPPGPGAGGTGNLDIGDPLPQPKSWGQTQRPGVHEFGHAVGQHHPGGPGNTYYVDPPSIMGAGMRVDPDHIITIVSGFLPPCGPWSF